MKNSRAPVFLIIVLFLSSLLPAAPGLAQESMGELAAVMEVLSPGVQVRRVNTVNWIAVEVEAIVGVGDIIRTDETGRARVTFFADGVDTELLPGSELQIRNFEGNDDTFAISVEILLGQTLQRVARVLNPGSDYSIQTPGLELTVRGTEFAVRVEQSRRSAVLVLDGLASASAQGEEVEVPAGYGVRAPEAGPLSDVVVATSFAELDAALDGCSVEIHTQDDVRLNVRLGPSREYPRVGTLDASDILILFGVSEAGSWYRVQFQGSYGWVLASDITLDPACAGLRRFPDTQTEDPGLYEALGESIHLEDLVTPQPQETLVPTESPEGPE